MDMTEETLAYGIAREVLETPNADPDDDLRVLARQLLRHKETVERQEKALQAVDWNGKATADLIHANRDQLLKVHEEALRRIGKALEGGGIILARAILGAAQSYHPTHEWAGWPEGS